jgi:hypothetical protein
MKTLVWHDKRVSFPNSPDWWLRFLMQLLWTDMLKN